MWREKDLGTAMSLANDDVCSANNRSSLENRFSGKCAKFRCLAQK